MSDFLNLRCVSAVGDEAPLVPSHPDNPYGPDWYKSPIALAVRQSRVSRICWDRGDDAVEIQFDYVVSAALDPTTDLLIVTLHYSDRSYQRPKNAVVINSDGTINHQITPPEFVEIAPPHSQQGRHPVECLDSVHVQSGRIIIGLVFCYEWVESRHYNVNTRGWEERIGVYRK